MNTTSTTAHAQQCAPSPAAPAVYSVKDFCAAHGITKVTLYKLLKEGIGPRIMKVGTRTLISLESAAEWKKARKSCPAAVPRRTEGGADHDRKRKGRSPFRERAHKRNHQRQFYQEGKHSISPE
jgi:predicted DNA-binding transcriptional regulator AlpA